MAIRATTDDHLIVRTTGLYGTRGQSRSRGNFVETMLRLGASGQELRVVCDQVLTPSATYDVATITRDLMHRGVRGTVHATNAGECSWYEFARAIFELAELSVSLSPVAQAERPAPARRPSYSVLEHGALRAAGLPEPRNWRDALEEYLERRTKV
jgi:dTDP-4-dehydrorhamnose reductase